MTRFTWLFILVSVSFCLADAGPDQYYELQNIKPPENCALEIGGMAFTSDNSLILSTRRGEIWTFKKNKWNRFASGLHEPLGLIAGESGEVFVMQRAELT